MLHMLLLEMLFSEYCIIFSHAIFFWAQPLTSFLYLSDRSWGHWHQISSVLMDFHSSLKLQTTVWRITEVTEGQRDSWKTLLLNWSYHAINCNHSILDNKSNKKSRDRITHQSNGRDDSQRHGWIYTHTHAGHMLSAASRSHGPACYVKLAAWRSVGGQSQSRVFGWSFGLEPRHCCWKRNPVLHGKSAPEFQS